MSMVESGTAPGSVTRQRPCCAPARTSRHFAAYCPRPIWRRPARCVAGGRSCSVESKLRGREAAGYVRRPASTTTVPGLAAPRGVHWMPKLVYDFTEGNKDLKDLLGGKGANLAEMTNLGLPVPPGFTITTDACRYYLEHGTVPDGLAAEVDEHLRQLERQMGRTLGDHA